MPRSKLLRKELREQARDDLSKEEEDLKKLSNEFVEVMTCNNSTQISSGSSFSDNEKAIIGRF